MIGTDSHTPNGGGLGMVAVGVGGGLRSLSLIFPLFSLFPYFLSSQLFFFSFSAPKQTINAIY